MYLIRYELGIPQTTDVFWAINHHFLLRLSSHLGLMYSTIDSGTASQATPRGRHRKRAGRARTDDQTIVSPSPWPQGHDIPARIYCLAAVLMCSYEYVMRYTESYLYVCWYTQYILVPVYTDLYWVQLLPFVRLSAFWEILDKRRKT